MNKLYIVVESFGTYHGNFDAPVFGTLTESIAKDKVEEYTLNALEAKKMWGSGMARIDKWGRDNPRPVFVPTKKSRKSEEDAKKIVEWVQLQSNQYTKIKAELEAKFGEAYNNLIDDRVSWNYVEVPFET